MPERRMIDQALATWSPTGGFGHVGLDRGLVDEGQSFQVIRHERLTFTDPNTAQVSNILALLLKRLKVFFCASARAHARTSTRYRDER